jgi:hypothetical protein
MWQRLAPTASSHRLYARWVTNQKEKQLLPTASAVLEDGTMVEMIFRPDLRRTLLAIYSAGRWTLQEKVELADGSRLVPFSPGNNLIKNEAGTGSLRTGGIRK